MLFTHLATAIALLNVPTLLHKHTVAAVPSSPNPEMCRSYTWQMHGIARLSLVCGVVSGHRQ